MWEALGEGELVKGSVGWESGVSPQRSLPLQMQQRSLQKKKKRWGGGTGWPGSVLAETRRVHPGVKEGDAGRKRPPLGAAWGWEEIGS